MTEPTLARTAEQLTEEVGKLHEVIGVIAAKSKRLRQIVLALGLTLVLVVAVGWQVVRVANCQAQYAQANANATQARDGSSSQARRDSEALWRAFLEAFPIRPGRIAAPPTPAQQQASLDAVLNYLASLDAADRAAKAYPLPANQCSIWP